MTKGTVQLVTKTTLLLVVFLALIFSFNNYFSKYVVIYYDFNGVAVTRIDRDGKTFFYYGRCDDNQKDCGKPFVKATYSGFNSGLDGLLHFKASGYVEVISLGGGYFTEKRSWNDKLLINDPENSTEGAQTLDSLRQCGSVIHFSDNINLEKKLNKKSKSKVNATYENNAL